jgi:Xaa-Pro aminopeptidase
MDSVIIAARRTKSQDEIERIRGIGKTTAAVVGQVADFLSSHRAKDQVLVKADGSPLTIGEVKSRINLWLAERRAENPEGTIFSIGHDAGVPHSVGIDSDFLRLGQTLIFDIFPCELGGGYFYDMTRTWCLGYAPDEAQELYDHVLSVYRQVSSELRLGAPCKIYQQRTCELFQALGHPTIQEAPSTQVGYVHSLGHGVGLQVHERPGLRASVPDSETLDANTVFTLEPGLYYPERGMGMRLEDTLWMRPDGVAEVLADYPLDLVLPVSV